MDKKQALIIFVRHPEKGKIKTRLAATLGDENALLVYRELLEHTRKITQNVEARKLLFYAGLVPVEDNWPDEIYAKYQQPEGDLGDRMNTAFGIAFAEGAGKVIIIGSDCFELTEEKIGEAFAKLDFADAVIGPAADGGYYLLGLKALNSSVFQNKVWSTNTVFQETVLDLERAGLTYVVLPVLRDVDEEKDLPEQIRDKLQNLC